MAGFAIHIAVASEYAKKHNVIDFNEFMEGTIDPDLVNDKSLTHYGNSSRDANSKLFLSNNNLNNDYNLGYLLHLIVDDYFYNVLLKDVDFNNIGEKLHNDYDVLNKYIINKYKIEIPIILKNKIFYSNSDLNYLNNEEIDKMIDLLSSIELYNKDCIHDIKVKRL